MSAVLVGMEGSVGGGPAGTTVPGDGCGEDGRTHPEAGGRGQRRESHTKRTGGQVLEEARREEI